LALDLVLEMVRLVVEAEVICLWTEPVVHPDLCLVRLAHDLGRSNLWAVVLAEDLGAFDE